MAAAVELEKTREFVSALDAENGVLKERLVTEKRISTLFAELSVSQKSEAEALRAAIAAKNETITAKNSVIAAQDKLAATLKSKRPSLWRRLGDVLIGAAAIAVLK